MLLNIGGNIFSRILRVAVDANEDHTSIAELTRQPVEPRAVELRQRALSTQEADHAKRRLAVVERLRRPLRRRQELAKRIDIPKQRLSCRQRLQSA